MVPPQGSPASVAQIWNILPIAFTLRSFGYKWGHTDKSKSYFSSMYRRSCYILVILLTLITTAQPQPRSHLSGPLVISLLPIQSLRPTLHPQLCRVFCDHTAVTLPCHFLTRRCWKPCAAGATPVPAACFCRDLQSSAVPCHLYTVIHSGLKATHIAKTVF